MGKSEKSTEKHTGQVLRRTAELESALVRGLERPR